MKFGKAGAWGARRQRGYRLRTGRGSTASLPLVAVAAGRYRR